MEVWKKENIPFGDSEENSIVKMDLQKDILARIDLIERRQYNITTRLDDLEKSLNNKFLLTHATVTDLFTDIWNLRKELADVKK